MINKRPNAFLCDYELSETFFHSLCTYKSFQQSLILPFYLPDTVIFRSGKPIAWYFSDAKGVLKEKKDNELGINNILSHFLGNKHSYDIIACLLSPTGVKHNDSGEGGRISVEYYDEKGLKGFLKNAAGVEKGILQKFVNPQTERNNAIEAVWSKDTCLLHKKINRRSLRDNNVTINEKCMTFDGPESSSTTIQLEGKVLTEMVKGLMGSIAEHLSKTVFANYDLLKIVSYFKVGQNNQLWYLWTTSVNLTQALQSPLKDQLANAKSEGVGDTNTNTKSKARVISGDSIKSQLRRCTNCDKNFAIAQMVNMTYKALIEKARNFLDSSEEFGNKPHIKSARISARSRLQAADTQRNDASELSGDLLSVLKLIHPVAHLEDLMKLIQDPLLTSKKVQICYSCYMILFTVSPRAPNPTSFRKYKEQAQALKHQKSSTSFVLKSLNKSGESSNYANSLYLNRNPSSESLERAKKVQVKDHQAMHSSRSQQKVHKEPAFYIKASSSHRRQQSSSILSTRIDRSASRSTGHFGLASERNESIGRESLSFTKLSNPQGDQTLSREENLSHINESRSSRRVRKIRLTSHDSKIQNISEAESTSEVYASVSYEKFPNSKSQALMKQIKQVSGFQAQGRVSERSTGEGSRDICGSSSENMSLLIKNGSGAGVERSAHRKRIESSFKRSRESSSEVLKIPKKSIEEISQSRLLSVEETTKLKNEIKKAIGIDEKGSNVFKVGPFSSLEKVSSVAAFNTKEVKSQSPRNRRIPSLSIRPKVKPITGVDDLTSEDQAETVTKPSDFSEMVEDTLSRVHIRHNYSNVKLRGESIGVKENKEQQELTETTFNICNDINRGIDFIKNKTFTRNTSWLTKKNAPPLRSHQKSSSLSLFASNSYQSSKDKSTQEITITPMKELIISQKPLIPPAALNIQKVFLGNTPVSNFSPKKEALAPIHEQPPPKELKVKKIISKNQPIQNQEALLKEYALSPSAEGPLSDRFEVCLMNKDHLNTFEISESDEGLDKAFVVGGDDSDIDLNMNKGTAKKQEARMFSPLLVLEDSEFKSMGPTSSQKLETKYTYEDREESQAHSIKGYNSELFLSRELFNKKKRLCILRKSSLIGRTHLREAFREKKVSFKEEVEEVTFEQVPQSGVTEEDQGVNTYHCEERLATGFSDESQEIEEMEEWQQEDIDRFFDGKMHDPDLLELKSNHMAVRRIGRVIMD